MSDDQSIKLWKHLSSSIFIAQSGSLNGMKEVKEE